MKIHEILKDEMSKQRMSQSWMVDSMNSLDSSLKMTNNKLSEILRGRRKIAGEEFIAICRVLKLETKDFLSNEKNAS